MTASQDHTGSEKDVTETIEGAIEKRTRSGLGGFIVRHEWFFSVLGACIVFTTFVVREGIQSSIDREASSLGSAESMYQLRKETAVTNARLEELEWEVKMRDGFVKAPAHPSKEWIECEALWERILLLQAGSKALVVLAGKVPGSHVNDQLDADSQALSEAQEEMSMARWINDVSPEDRKDTQHALAKAEVMVQKIEMDRSNYEGVITDTIQERESRAAELSKRASWVSVGLFSLGWLLSMVSKVPTRPKRARN